VFPNRTDAERAIQDLRSAGFRDDQIGILTRDHSTGAGPGDVQDTGNKAGEAAGVGAIIGGIIGAGAALLIPGIGPVIAGGILAGVLGGAAVGAAAGGIIGALVGLGIPENEAHYYEGEFRKGRTLVTVKAADRYDEARRILRDDGAYDIQDQTAGQMGTGFTGTQTNVPAASGTQFAENRFARNADATGEMRIPVAEEQLVPEKHREQVGEVDVTKRVVEEQRTIDVPVSREQVNVERRAVNEPVPPGAHPFQDQTIRIPVTEEEVTATKQPRVVGEVVVNRERVTEDVPVTGTVRREEVDVNRQNQGGTGFRSWNEAMPTYRANWQRQYGTSGGRWEDYEPYYQFGYNAWSNPRYQNRDWTTVEPQLRQEWMSSHPNTPWDRVRTYVQQVWTSGQRAA